MRLTLFKMPEYIKRLNHDKPELEILPSVICYNDIKALHSIYEKHGREVVNAWMCEHHGYYRALRSGNQQIIHCIKSEQQHCADILTVSDQVLIDDIHEGDLVVIRVAAELGRLNNLVPEIVKHIHHKTMPQLSMAKQYGVDLCATFGNDNTLLHLLAKAVPIPLSSQTSSMAPEPLKHYFEWVIEKLLEAGLKLDARNADLRIPEDLARMARNDPFCAAVNSDHTKSILRLSLGPRPVPRLADEVAAFAKQVCRIL